jgi:hypothetical protein
MKQIKRIAAVLLSAVMIMTLTVTASAYEKANNDDGSIYFYQNIPAFPYDEDNRSHKSSDIAWVTENINRFKAVNSLIITAENDIFQEIVTNNGDEIFPTSDRPLEDLLTSPVRFEADNSFNLEFQATGNTTALAANLATNAAFSATPVTLQITAAYFAERAIPITQMLTVAATVSMVEGTPDTPEPGRRIDTYTLTFGEITYPSVTVTADNRDGTTHVLGTTSTATGMLANPNHETRSYPEYRHSYRAGYYIHNWVQEEYGFELLNQHGLNGNKVNFEETIFLDDITVYTEWLNTEDLSLHGVSVIWDQQADGTYAKDVEADVDAINSKFLNPTEYMNGYPLVDPFYLHYNTAADYDDSIIIYTGAFERATNTLYRVYAADDLTFSNVLAEGCGQHVWLYDEIPFVEQGINVLFTVRIYDNTELMEWDPNTQTPVDIHSTNGLLNSASFVMPIYRGVDYDNTLKSLSINGTSLTPPTEAEVWSQTGSLPKLQTIKVPYNATSVPFSAEVNNPAATVRVEGRVTGSSLDVDNYNSNEIITGTNIPSTVSEESTSLNVNIPFTADSMELLTFVQVYDENGDVINRAVAYYPVVRGEKPDNPPSKPNTEPDTGTNPDTDPDTDPGTDTGTTTPRAGDVTDETEDRDNEDTVVEAVSNSSGTLNSNAAVKAVEEALKQDASSIVIDVQSDIKGISTGAIKKIVEASGGVPVKVTSTIKDDDGNMTAAMTVPLEEGMKQFFTGVDFTEKATASDVDEAVTKTGATFLGSFKTKQKENFGVSVTYEVSASAMGIDEDALEECEENEDGVKICYVIVKDEFGKLYQVKGYITDGNIKFISKRAGTFMITTESLAKPKASTAA